MRQRVSAAAHGVGGRHKAFRRPCDQHGRYAHGIQKTSERISLIGASPNAFLRKRDFPTLRLDSGNGAQQYGQHQRKPWRNSAEQIDDLVRGKHAVHAAHPHDRARRHNADHLTVHHGFQRDFISDEVAREHCYAEMVIGCVPRSPNRHRGNEAEIEYQRALFAEFYRIGKGAQVGDCQIRRMSKQNCRCNHGNKINQIDCRMIAVKAHVRPPSYRISSECVRACTEAQDRPVPEAARPQRREWR